jgi:soluble lytic murein transglycosylase-like protein
MKLHEIALTEEQLNEIRMRNALAVAGLAGTAAISALSNHYTDQQNKADRAAATQPASQVSTGKIQPRIDPTEPLVAKAAMPQPPAQTSVKELSQMILDKYGSSVDPHTAMQVAKAAKKYEKPGFPRAEDILAIVGIESSFDPESVSGLKHDPARGLMQVRPKIWNLTPKSLSTIDKQIKVGSTILHHYYQKLGTVPSAVHAYNVGLTNFNHKKNLNPEYVRRFNAERQQYPSSI